MKLNEFITIIIMGLAIVATAFVSVRNDISKLNREVSRLEAKYETFHEVCCGEIK